MQITQKKPVLGVFLAFFALLLIPCTFAAGNISLAEMAISFDSVNATHALDTSGNGHHLFLATGTPRYIDGVIGNASNTTGRQNITPYLMNDERTICFSTTGKASTQTFLDIAGDGTLQYQFYGDPGYELALFEEVSTGKYIYAEVENTPFDGNFHDYCIVNDGGTDSTAFTVYIDGVLQNLSNIDEDVPFINDGSQFTGSTAFSVGFVADGQNNLYDQIYQYDEALNASQVQSIHNNHTAECGYPFQCGGEEEEPEPEPEPETDNSDVDRSLSVMAIIIGIGILVSVMGAILTFTDNKDALTYFSYVTISVIVLTIILVLTLF